MRVGRIELPSDPWQGPILPLNYTRKWQLLRSDAQIHKLPCALGGTRTPNPRFRRPVLYPLSYECNELYNTSFSRFAKCIMRASIDS